MTDERLSDMEQTQLDKRDHKMASFFDQCYESGLFRDFDNGEKERACDILDVLGDIRGWRVIEPGCGCGRFTRLLANRVGETGCVEACELSPLMIGHCRDAGFAPHVRFHHASILDLDLEEGMADAVICFNVWPHFEFQERYLARFRQLLKPEGMLYIAHSCGRDFINGIHGDAESEEIRGHLLPPAEELMVFLRREGWRPVADCDETDRYYVLSLIDKHGRE